MKHFGFLGPGLEPGERTLSNRRNKWSMRSCFSLATVPPLQASSAGPLPATLAVVSPGTASVWASRLPLTGYRPPRGGRSRAVSSPAPHIPLDNSWIQAMAFGFRNVFPGLPAEPQCGMDGGASLRAC